jgi:hypothetical protein
VEIDEAALRVRVDQADAHAIADVEAVLPALDAALDGIGLAWHEAREADHREAHPEAMADEIIEVKEGS